MQSGTIPRGTPDAQPYNADSGCVSCLCLPYAVLQQMFGYTEFMHGDSSCLVNIAKLNSFFMWILSETTQCPMPILAHFYKNKQKKRSETIVKKRIGIINKESE